MMAADCGPPEQKIADGLRGSLPLRCTAPLVPGDSFRHIRRIRRCHLLLDLQEQRILRTVAFEQHHVIPQADASGPYTLEPDIDGAEQIEEMPPVRGKIVAIWVERTEDLLRLGSSNPPKPRPQIAKTPLTAAVQLRILRTQNQRAR